MVDAAEKDQPKCESESKPEFDQKLLPEQYKAYMDDVGRLCNRQDASDRYYLGVVSALLVFVSLAGDREVFNNDNFVLIPMATGFVAILVSVLWRRHMISFGGLLRAKYDVLRDIEREAKLYPIYRKEKEIAKSDGRYRSHADMAARMPLLFSVMFIVSYHSGFVFRG